MEIAYRHTDMHIYIYIRVCAYCQLCSHLFVIPKECDVSLSEGERHAGDCFWEIEGLSRISPMLGLYHPFAPAQLCHIPANTSLVFYNTAMAILSLIQPQ